MIGKELMKSSGIILTLILMSALISSAPAKDIKEGLVTCWNFDDGTARDSVNSNHGTIIGPARFEARTVAGMPGKAIVLSGEDNYVTVPDAPALNFNQDITVSLWICWDGQEGKYPGLVSKGYPSDQCLPGESSYSIQIRKDVDLLWWQVDMTGKEKKNYLVGYLSDGSRVVDNSIVKNAYQIYYSPADAKVFPGRWTHVATTFDGVRLEIYINGQRMQAAPEYRIPLPGKLDISKMPLEIGRLPGYHCFKGMMDDIRLYNRALSAQKIEGIYRSGK